MKFGVTVFAFGLLCVGPALGQHVRQSIFALDPNGREITSFRHGVQVMQSRPPTDPTSWIFQANIHSTTDAPANQQESQAWSRCQHGSFYFLSWHRMYLLAVEGINYDKSPDLNYEIYIDLPKNAKPNYKSPYFVGLLTFFQPHAAEHPFVRSFDLTSAFRTLRSFKAGNNPSASITFVPSGLVDRSGKPLPIPPSTRARFTGVRIVAVTPPV